MIWLLIAATLYGLAANSVEFLTARTQMLRTRRVCAADYAEGQVALAKQTAVAAEGLRADMHAAAGRVLMHITLTTLLFFAAT